MKLLGVSARVTVLTVLLAAPAAAQLAPPNDAGVTMGHVHLNVRDAEVQEKLWVEHFGATPLAREGLPGVKVPGMLVLFRQQPSAGGTEGTVLDHFGFKIPNLAEFLQRWRAAGYEVQREFKGTEGFPNAYIMGPDNLKLELQEDTSLKVKALSYHLHYTVANHVKLRDWYAEKFSLVSRKRGEHDTADVPGMNLTFQTPREPPTIGTKGRTLDHIGFEVRNLEAFCKKLEAAGVKLDVAYRKVPNLGIALAFLTDPSGVYIELTEGLDKY
jgi:catechol 2,3-dioxygenase-like lactoylglutathione lyase family enzyme